MSNDELDKNIEEPRVASNGHIGLLVALCIGLALALAGDVYLWTQSNQLKSDLAQSQDNTQTQISKLGDATTALLQQRLEAINEDLKAAHDSADSALKRARFETQKQGKELAQRLDQQQQQVSGELTQLKDATTTASTKIDAVSTDVTGVKTDVTGVKADVASTQTEVEKHGTDLKRVMGDMGVMSGLIATNSKDLVALRELGDRNYIEFDLTKKDASKKIGDITLTLRKSDPKRNRYTVAVLADDKTLEKRDKTINEPVQLYVAGNRQPYEIVVNEVKKDEVVGYLATPKVHMARR
jgi:chromosome segregation ATPase